MRAIKIYALWLVWFIPNFGLLTHQISKLDYVEKMALKLNFLILKNCQKQKISETTPYTEESNGCR